MKVSIITICFNSAECIEHTIKSVQSQSYPHIEYIIVDGNSTDNTLEIVNKYKDSISTIVSEQDNGLYDAINKGIKLSTGDVVGLIHSDDFLAYNDVIKDVAKCFTDDQDLEGVYGDLDYVEKDYPNKVFRKWRSGEYTHGMFVKGWMPPHPTLYLRKELFEKYGDYRYEDFKFAADYELMLRFIHKFKIKLRYLPKVLVKMRVGGKSNASIKNRLKANREDRKAWIINNLSPGPFTLMLKPLSKVLQFVKK